MNGLEKVNIQHNTETNIIEMCGLYLQGSDMIQMCNSLTGYFFNNWCIILFDEK